MPVFWLHYDFLWHVCMLVRWIELDILRGCLMAHLTTRSIFTLGKNSIFEHKRNKYICKSNAVPIEGESLVKTSSHSLNYLLAADEWQWQASTKQWQANVECDDKSEFVVRQIRACGDKSASGAWQIQTTCESNTLCLSHLLVNRLGGLQLNATATQCLCLSSLQVRACWEWTPGSYRDCNRVVQNFHTLQLVWPIISKYLGWENRNSVGRYIPRGS